MPRSHFITSSNIRLTIAYDGTKYAGWQVQKNANTVQSEIEKALRKILREKVRLIGVGRTDSGVHAKAYVANFASSKGFPQSKVPNALNAILPKDISIVKARKTYKSFHSRFKAKSKLYKYLILNSSIDNPFVRKYYWKVPYNLDLSLMKKEAKTLLGRHDFKSFQAKSGQSKLKSTTRSLKKIAIHKKGEFVHIDIEADGFLYNMARNIVGTLVEIARGHLPEGTMKTVLKACNRKKAGPTAPAKGLTLLKVKY